MIGIYQTDQVKLVLEAKDKYGGTTQTVGDAITARVEDFNQMITDNEGKEVLGEMLIFLDPNETVTYNHKILIIKKNGVDYQQPSKQFMIKKIAKLGLFGKAKSIEVYI